MPSLLDDSKVHTSGLLGLSQAIALLSATEEVKIENHFILRCLCQIYSITII